MAKIIGYILSVLGLVGIAFSNKIAALPMLADLGKKALIYPIMASAVLIVIGIVFLMEKSSEFNNVKHASEEVPIYEGEGKKRRIVGYKKESKK